LTRTVTRGSSQNKLCDSHAPGGESDRRSLDSTLSGYWRTAAFGARKSIGFDFRLLMAGSMPFRGYL
jgi:hypothetical protein